eukprot:401494-Prymnesium_polylepis.1
MAQAGPGSPDTSLISNIDGETRPKSTVWISLRYGSPRTGGEVVHTWGITSLSPGDGSRPVMPQVGPQVGPATRQ